MQVMFGTNSISCSDSSQQGQHVLVEGAKLLHVHTKVKIVLTPKARPGSQEFSQASGRLLEKSDQITFSVLGHFTGKVGTYLEML